MRKLVILRGVMASGKSTFIKENHLEEYTLSSDTLRLMLNATELTAGYTEMIPQFNNKKVWNLLYYFLEERMKKGEFTIVDAIHATKEDFAPYKKLAEKYRYRTYVVDFTDISYEELLRRNKTRENYKQVPEESILRVYKKIRKETVPGSFRILKPEEFESILTTKPIDRNNYKNIHIFGDIHGCIRPLKKYFKENPYNEEDAYIFLGDYFDRGLENYETFKFLSELLEKKNCIFLVGNHEEKLYKYASEEEFKMDLDSKRTILELEGKKVSKKELRGFYKKLSQLAYITFRGQTYLITHGGIPYFPEKPIDFYSTNSFVYGMDKYEVDIDKIYNEYMEKQENKIIQIHGHRNYFKNKVDAYPYSYNLEGNIEEGGDLRILDLNEDGTITSTLIKNDYYNKNLEEETEIFNLIETLRNNKYVYEKELGNSISSFNFTKEAFYNSVWDNITTKARGLFINTEEYKIVARSYNKFFKIGERKETQLETLQETISYPVEFYLKYNGFLGILSLVNNEFFFASKSTNTGDYVEYFKNIFYKTFNEKQREEIKEKLKNENATMVFEVMDPTNDAHIIKYDQEGLVLLDIIKNKINYEKLSYEELKEFAKKNNIWIKECVYEANNKEEFMSIYKEITKEEYQFNNEYIEGFVLEDKKGDMTKTKTKYYEEWKYLRTKMEKAVLNQEFHCKNKQDLENKFMEFLKNKYENKEVDKNELNIIKEREEFFNQTKQVE